jgi:hypothetical protein
LSYVIYISINVVIVSIEMSWSAIQSLKRKAPELFDSSEDEEETVPVPAWMKPVVLLERIQVPTSGSAKQVVTIEGTCPMSPRSLSLYGGKSQAKQAKQS